MVVVVCYGKYVEVSSNEDALCELQDPFSTCN